MLLELADRGCGAAWFRDAAENKGIKPSILPRKGRKIPPATDSAKRSRTAWRASRTGGA